MSRYKNQNKIDEIEKELKQIDESLTIGRWEGKEICFSVATTFPFAGNGKIIKELEKLGWRRGGKRKNYVTGGFMMNMYKEIKNE
jgi:hypothetical protein